MENNHEQLEDKGIISLSREIREFDSKRLRRSIYEYFIKNGKAPKIFIDCPGGDILSALDLYDCIKSLPVPVNAVVVGECASASLLVLAACANRSCTQNSNFFFHSSNNAYTIKNHLSEKERCMRVRTKMSEIVNTRSQEILCREFNISAEKLFDLEWEGENCDYRIFPEEAKSLGIIHEIIEKIPELEAFKK